MSRMILGISAFVLMVLPCACHRAQRRQRLLLRAHLNPRLGQAAFHGATSCLARECSRFPAQSVCGEGHPRAVAHQHHSSTERWDTRAQCTSLIPRLLWASPALGSTAALQPGCSLPAQNFGMWVRNVDSACLPWESLSTKCTGVWHGGLHQGQMYLSHRNLPSQNWDVIVHRPRSCRLLHLQFGS